MKNENKVDQYINKQCAAQIKDVLKTITCDHTWWHHGFGYVCSKCDYYTGSCTEINKLIEKQAKKLGIIIPDGNMMMLEKNI